MNKIVKYSLITASALVVLLLGWNVLGDKAKEAEVTRGKTEVLEETKKQDQPEVVEIAVADLKIHPVKSLEKEVYMLTAYDVPDENTFVLIGNFEGKNVVRFFDLGTNQIKAELSLPEILLDVFSKDDQIYVLGEKNIFVVTENQVVRTIKHQIPAVFTFDRLLSLDDQLLVSMSDGSAWVIGEKEVKRIDKLNMMGSSIWVQKTSASTFSVELSEDRIINYNSETSLGAMTVLGEMNNELICIIEKITSQKPLVVKRAISSSQDDFFTELQVVDMQPYAFLKNDLRVHGDVVYHLVLHQDKVSLISQKTGK